MIVIDNRQVFSTEGHMVHRLGTDLYFKRGTVLPSDTTACFEEVESIPEPTTTDYDERVNDSIRQRYTLSQELAILRQRDTKPDEYVEYYAYCEHCKRQCRENSTDTI